MFEGQFLSVLQHFFQCLDWLHNRYILLLDRSEDTLQGFKLNLLNPTKIYSFTLFKKVLRLHWILFHKQGSIGHHKLPVFFRLYNCLYTSELAFPQNNIN